MFETVLLFTDRASFPNCYERPRMGFVVGPADRDGAVNVCVLGDGVTDAHQTTLRGVDLLPEYPKRGGFMEFCVPVTAFPRDKSGSVNMEHVGRLRADYLESLKPKKPAPAAVV